MGFMPTTKVLTEDAGYVPISELTPGRRLLTPLGTTEVTVCVRHNPDFHYPLSDLGNSVVVSGHQCFISADSYLPCSVFNRQGWNKALNTGIVQPDGFYLKDARFVSSEKIFSFLPGVAVGYPDSQLNYEPCWELGTANKLAVVGSFVTVASTSIVESDARSGLVEGRFITNKYVIEDLPVLTASDLILFGRYLDSLLVKNPSVLA